MKIKQNWTFRVVSWWSDVDLTTLADHLLTSADHLLTTSLTCTDTC